MNSNKIVAASSILAFGLVGITATGAEAATYRSAALSTARQQIGDPYRYGGTGPTYFDCSGLVQYSYKKNGKSLPRTAQQQYNSVPHVSPSNRQVGDLVFIGTSTRNIYHVGIYTGWKSNKGWMVNANTGSYRGRKVVNAPVSEYTSGSPKAYYGRVSGSK